LIDPILEELHAIRERLLSANGGTLAGLVARLQEEQAESGRVLWVPRTSQSSLEAADPRLPEIATSPSTHSTR
jgi:hypothetical protein